MCTENLAGLFDLASLGNAAQAGSIYTMYLDGQSADMQTSSTVKYEAGIESDEDTGKGDGCSCGSNSPASGWSLLVVFLLFAFRRRAS